MTDNEDTVYDEVPVLDVTPADADNTPAVSEPEPVPAETVVEEAAPEEPPMQVITLTDLLDALTAASPADEEVPAEPEAAEEAAGEDSAAGDDDTETGPSQSELAYQLLSEIRHDVAPHPLLTTPFSEYTVSEGLLLLVLLWSLISLCVRMLKGGFSWLLW